jgi:hypothetical protein
VDLNLVEKFRIAARNAISAGEWWWMTLSLYCKASKCGSHLAGHSQIWFFPPLNGALGKSSWDLSILEFEC